MTRPTQFGPARAAGWQTVGGDPSLPTGQFPADCCDDTPPDRAAGVSIFVGVSADDFALVQSNFDVASNGTGSITVTFLDDPTPGNLLVAAFTIRSTASTVPTGPSGWTKVADVDSATGDGNSGGSVMWYRVAEPGDGPSVTVTGAANYKRLAIAEFAGPGTLGDQAEKDGQAAATSYPVGPADLTGAGILVGLVQVSNEPVTFTDDAAFTQVDQGKCDTFAPTHILAYRTAAAGSYSFTPTSATNDTWCGILAAFDSGDTWILGGNRATDGDDVTYETISGLGIIRINVGAPLAIVTTRIRVSTVSSGVRSFTIKGANAPDFSDAVTLTTIGWTALGSDAAQDVVATWLTSDAYQFYELDGDDEERRIYSFELYEGTAVTAVTTTAADLADHVADPTDAHDASAVSLLDAGTLFTATDLEAALQELAKKDIGVNPPHGAMGSTETFSALFGWHYGTFSANCTATFSGATSGLVASMVLELTSDGSSVMTWPGSVVWAGGSAPTLSTTPGHVDVILFMSRDGGTTWYGFPSGTGSTGTVTSIALTTPAEFGVAGSPVTTSGTLAISKATQSANTVWAGPTTGSAAQPAFRALVAADIPAGVGGGSGDHVHVVDEQFSGDASAVDFNLANSAVPDSVMAYVSGTRTPVTLGGTLNDVITFGSAPASASLNISVDYAAVLD